MSSRPLSAARVAAAAALVSFSLVSSLHAGTIAYWRFEGDGVNPATTGTQVEDFNGHTDINTGVGIRAIDSVGGNTLWAWEHDWAGHTYQPNVFAPTVPLTGASNSFSIQNSGGFPALGTWSEQSNPTGVNVQTWAPTTWSMEVSFNLTNVNGWQTFVGRDGNNVKTGEAAHAPFYFQKMGDGSNRVRVVFVDTTGVARTVIDPVGVSADQWYNYAVTSDGTSMKLFRKGPDDGGAYLNVATTSMTPGSTMITPGNYANGDLGKWAWTVGRGSYGTGTGFGDNHGDRVFGYLDEVRFSDTALTEQQLLWYNNITVPTGRDIVWTGSSSSTWDVNTTSNFTFNGNATNFTTNDRVTIAAANQTISLAQNITMGNLVINGNSDLAFDGAGGLNGTGGLTKNGTGNLVIRNLAANGFSGPIAINGGTVEITGDGTAATAIGSGDMVLNGTLIANRAATVFISNNISGSGSIISRNFTVLSGNNTFDGQVTAEANTLYLDSANALGSTVGATIVQPGAQLGIFLGDFVFNETVSLSGTGVGTGGAIRTGGNRTVTFAGPMTLNSVVSVYNDGGSTLKFTGNVTGGSDVQFYKGGTGTFETKAFEASWLYAAEGTLRVASGAAKVQTLTIDAVLDVTKGALAVDYTGASPYAELLGKITSANLINSAGSNYAVALVDNAARLTPFTTFAGLSVDSSTVLIRGTLKGDANLDAVVNFDDLLLLAQNYDAAGTGKTWDMGDTNYDGIVNFDDLLSLAQNYGASALTGAQLDEFGDSFAADWTLALSLAPEPTSLMSLGAAAMMVRRRRA